MKSRSGSRDGTWISGVDGLVALPVQIRRLPNSSNVMWQRQFSKGLKMIVKITRMMELQPEATGTQVAHNPGCQVFIEPNLAAHGRLLSRVDDGNPQAALAREAL